MRLLRSPAPLTRTQPATCPEGEDETDEIHSHRIRLNVFVNASRQTDSFAWDRTHARFLADPRRAEAANARAQLAALNGRVSGVGLRRSKLYGWVTFHRHVGFIDNSLLPEI